MVGVGSSEFLQEEHRSDGIHDRGAHDHFLSRLQVQGAIKVQVVSPWRNFDDWRLPHRRPHDLLGGLQVERGFIASDNYGVGRTLGRVEQVFSSASSKPMTFVSLSD